MKIASCKRLAPVILTLSLTFTAAAGSRLRIDEGARSRQTRLSSSNLHTCAVLDDGTVRCWGYNADGEVGDGTTSTPKLSAVQVSGLVNIVSVAAGYNHSCALHAFGAVFCWGSNVFGQLGDGTTTPRPAPVQVRGLDNVTAVAAGQGFTCALRANGSVWCWGTGGLGQLGNGVSGAGTGSLTPVQVGTTLPAVAITAGQAHACAVLLDPTSGAIAQCWGFNSTGQLGDGSATLRSLPVTVSGLTGVVDIAGGQRHTCALLVTGSVSCWGYNADGQIGDGNTFPSVFTPVPAVVDAALHPIDTAVAISAGGNHSCAIFADGSVRCWGDDTFGQLGDATNNNVRDIASTAVFGLADGFEVVTGVKHTCAVEVVNFTGRCWGDNSLGQLGNGTTNPASTPNTVNGVPGSTGIGGRSIRTGDRWTCARRGNSSIACWGGTGNHPVGPNPATIASLSDGMTLAMNSSTTCAVESVGNIACFDDDVRQPFIQALGSLVGTSMGAAHTCMLDIFGSPFCVGDNSRGQLGSPNGNGVVDAQNHRISNVVMMVSGAFHSCALIVDGTVFCWGDNTSGQLGMGTVGGFVTTPFRFRG